MPFRIIRERYFTATARQTPFIRRATLFQDIVVRCVRYAFAEIPASIGAVFFSKPVALPFLRFRMLRHGHLRSPLHWREISRPGLKGLYMIHDSSQRPDIVLYYAHGGGFSMGSAYFYLEFLFAWLEILHQHGYANPAIFALEYTLVPTATYPTQVQETLAGYKYVLSIAPDPNRVVVSGDSAGATLILSLLLLLSDYAGMRAKLPALAIPISPWATLISAKNKDTDSDYLNAESLRLYGSQYIGSKANSTDALVSPGDCKDRAWWRRASPTNGWFFVHGQEEVFAPETKELMGLLQGTGVEVRELEEEGWVHAWPVVKLFLCYRQEERLGGLRRMTEVICEKVPVGGEY